MKTWKSWVLGIIGIVLMISFIPLAYELLVYFYGDYNPYHNKPTAAGKIVREASSFLVYFTYVPFISMAIFVLVPLIKRPKLFRIVAASIFFLSLAPYVWHFSKVFDQDHLNIGMVEMILKNDTTRLKRLVYAGANPDAIVLTENTNKKRYSPLMLAAMKGYSAVADFLVGQGADTSYRNVDNHTASDLAHSRGHTQLGEKLKPK